MTRAALTKLMTVVILAFIICLPEFFSLYRVSKVNFYCVPYQQCKCGNQVKRGENGKTRDDEMKRKEECDPTQRVERERWKKVCTQWNLNNTADHVPGSRRVNDDLEESWFMCQTEMDVAALHSNMSSSAAAALKARMEVSVELQLSGAEPVNLTLYGNSNRKVLHLHPPEEQKKVDEGLKAFYCCLSVLPTSQSDNQSCCLLWLSNQTLHSHSTATAKEEPQWKWTQTDEWQCMVRVLWWALLCVVLLTVVTVVFNQIYLGLQPVIKKPMTNTFGNLVFHELNETLTHKELSPIEEAYSQEDAETLLDGNIIHCYNANLHHHHHRHPPSSSITEEQQEDFN